VTYKEASRNGYEYAELSQQAYINKTMAVYRSARDEITDKIKGQYAKLAGVAKEDYYNEVLKYNRLANLEAEITKVYKSAATEAAKYTKTGLSTAMVESYNRQLFLASYLADVKAMPINTYLVKYSITGNLKYWEEISKTALSKMLNKTMYTPQGGTLTQLLTKNYRKELDSILQSIQSGFITGKSYTDQAMSIRQIIGKYIPGIDEKATGAMANALRIARTEGNRVLNAGALQSAVELSNQGFDVKKEWLSTIDTVTRDAHRGLDGQQKDVDKPFIYGDAYGQAPGQMGSAKQNIHCRCSTMTIIGGEEPEIRRARNPITGKNEVIDFTTYQEWENGL
jgi:hypothetical protein